ncbi:hypothetical protein POTOM_020106 [Populus tomentosa]|uniref:Uncharacterized protein n=1 Tax=Populus tomentosa TaxID=118781 RepID=A0A8X8CUS5_POPTO|nr:hypothetical protein POTOM_020106 [Populus tomentosa]
MREVVGIEVITMQFPRNRARGLSKRGPNRNSSAVISLIKYSFILKFNICEEEHEFHGLKEGGVRYYLVIGKDQACELAQLGYFSEFSEPSLT